MGVGFVSLVLEGVVRWSSLFQKEKDVHIGRQRRDVNKKEPFVARASDCCDSAHEQPVSFMVELRLGKSCRLYFAKGKAPPENCDQSISTIIDFKHHNFKPALKKTTYIVAKSIRS